MCACNDRIPDLRRLELRGPASDEALLSVLSTVNSALRCESVTGKADADVSRANQHDADWIMMHLKDTGMSHCYTATSVLRSAGFDLGAPAGRGGGGSSGAMYCE